MSVAFKIYFNLPGGKQEIRRFSSPAHLSGSLLSAVVSYLTATYSQFYASPLPPFLLQWDDGEDMCNVSSEAEMQEARAVAGDVMKLWCRFDDARVAATPATADGSSGPPSPSERVAEEVVVDRPHTPSGCVEDGLAFNSDNELDGNLSDDEYVRIDENGSPKARRSPAPPAAEEEASLAAHPSAVADAPSSSVEEEPSSHSTALVVPSPSSLVPTSHFKGPTTLAVRPSASSSSALVLAARETAMVSVETGLVPRETSLVSREGGQLVPLETGLVARETSQQLVPAQTETSLVSTQTSLVPVETSLVSTQTSLVPTETKLVSTQTSVVPVHSSLMCADSSMVPPVNSLMASCSSSEQAMVRMSEALATVSQALASVSVPRVDEPSSNNSSPRAIAGSCSRRLGSGDSSSSSSVARSQVVHHGIICDGCEMNPLVGDRYSCTECRVAGGFDLCSACEAAGSTLHPHNHVMLKMKLPADRSAGSAQHRDASHVWVGAQLEQPKAQFISDITLADGLEVKSGEVLKKVWSIKNIGNHPWPYGTRLVFAGGDLMPESDNRTADSCGSLVPFAAPNAVVHVAIDIVVPNECGRFRATFRLESPDRVRFGPRIWIDLVVPENAPEEEDDESDDDEEQECAHEDEEEDEEEESDEEQKDSEEEEDDEEEESDSSHSDVEDESVSAYQYALLSGGAAPVTVNTVPQQDDNRYGHRSAAAPFPSFSFFSSSSSSSSAAAECKQSEEAALASEFAACMNYAAVASGDVAPSANCSATLTNQLATLRAMGFQNTEQCRRLLLDHEGDIQKVVACILSA